MFIVLFIRGYLWKSKKYKKAYNLIKEELEEKGSLEEKKKCYNGFFEVVKKKAELQSEADFGNRFGMIMKSSLVDVTLGVRVLADLGKEYGFNDENWKEYTKRQRREKCKSVYDRFHNKLFN